MTETPTLDSGPLAVACPDCMAPAGRGCIGTTHASRIDTAAVRASLRDGTCALCGRRLVRYQLHGQDVAVHPDPADADACPVIPDPQRDMAGWSTAINLGYEPGKPGVENWRPADDRDALVEEGRRLASERDDLIARGVDPAQLDVPRIPGDPDA